MPHCVGAHTGAHPHAQSRVEGTETEHEVKALAAECVPARLCVRQCSSQSCWVCTYPSQIQSAAKMPGPAADWIVLSAALLILLSHSWSQEFAGPCALHFSLVTKGPVGGDSPALCLVQGKRPSAIASARFDTFLRTLLPPCCFVSILLYLKGEPFHKIPDFSE